MPKVDQEHLDARRQQIVDGARVCFADQGFARTSMVDIVTASGLSTGAIYRYFKSKDEIVVAVCEQGADAFPTALTPEAIDAFLSHVRTLAQEGHARLIAQINAEAALSPTLAAVVRGQLAALRARVVELLGDDLPRAVAEEVAEGFVAVSSGYNQQLAVRGDLAPDAFARALSAVVEVSSGHGADVQPGGIGRPA